MAAELNSDPITAVLNCYGPTGANIAQVIVRQSGLVYEQGEESLAARALLALGNFARCRKAPSAPRGWRKNYER